MTTTPTTGKREKLCGKLCLMGFCECGGHVGGSGLDAGFRLPAKLEKRLKVLRAILGPPPKDGYPERLLLPPGKVADGGMGDVRYNKAHMLDTDIEVLRINRDGEVHMSAVEVPKRPLNEVTNILKQQQLDQQAEPAALDDTDARPARGERQQQAAARTLINACEAALKACDTAEENGEVPEGTAASIRARLDVLSKSYQAAHKRAYDLEEKLKLHKRAAVANVKGKAELEALRAKVVVLEKSTKGKRGGVLSFEAFTTDRHLMSEIHDFLFFPTVEVLRAHIAFLNACCPLDMLVWLDSDGRGDEGGGGNADGGDEGGDGEGGDATPMDIGGEAGRGKAQKLRRKFPLSPSDAIVMWLFMLRTGTRMKRTAKLFGVSRQTARRAFITMTQLHKLIFKEEFFKLEEPALRAIVPTMMKTFKEYEGVDTTVVHIIDGFECKMQKPSDDEAAAACWSSYKHNYTAKFLLDILSNGAFYFISDAYPGSISDPDLSRVCGFLELMIDGLDVMADKGFLLQAELQALGCLCWIPPIRRKGQAQCTAEESEETHRIANRRIYIEHGVRNIKEFGYFGDSTLSIQHKHLHGDVAYCIAMLCNYSRPLVPYDEE